MYKQEEDDILLAMPFQEEPGKTTKIAPEVKPTGSLQEKLDNQARSEGFTVGPVWHGSPDFVGDAFDMRHLGRLSGVSRGGINFTSDRARAEAYRDAVFSDSEQAVIDDAVQMVNDAIKEATLTGAEQDRLRQETGYEWETLWFSGRNVDEWSDFQAHLQELSTWFRQNGKEELASAMQRASGLEVREQRPKLVRAFLKNPRIEIQNRTGEAVYIVDDPAQIMEVPKMQYSIEGPEFKEWFGNSKVVDEQGVPLKVFHGTTTKKIDIFNIPAFFTDDKSGAEYFLYDEPDGIIVEAYLSFRNPFYACHSREESMAFIDLARRAGVEIMVTEGECGWSFEAQDIAKNSPYDGTNINHLAYIPAVREQLSKEGYDSVITSDVLENTEIETYIALSPEQVRIVAG